MKFNRSCSASGRNMTTTIFFGCESRSAFVLEGRLDKLYTRFPRGGLDLDLGLDFFFVLTCDESGEPSALGSITADLDDASGVCGGSVFLGLENDFDGELARMNCEKSSDSSGMMWLMDSFGISVCFWI